MEGSPERPKRFTLSSEWHAEEKIEALKQAVAELRAEHPECVGVSLFGSLVKGTAKPESDIDALVLVDPDVIPDAGDEPQVAYARFDHALFQNGAPKQVTFHYPDLRQDLRERYEQLARSAIQRHLPSLTDAQLEHVFVDPMNERLLREMLDEIIASYKKYPDGVPQHTFHLTHSITQGEEGRQVPDGMRIEPNQLLYMLFHLDVGGGLPPYRRLLINRLKAEGEVGEQVWRQLISLTESWEQQNKLGEPTGLRYPRTLSEAEQVYG